jgi:hypothetical protein
MPTQLLVLAMLAGCGGGDDFTTPRTPMPLGMAGDWASSSGSGSSYYSPGGSYGAPNSNQYAYHFTDDGYYEHSALLQSSLYSCTMSFFGDERGTVVADDHTLTVYPNVATIKSTDTCHSDNNYEKDGQKNVLTFGWRFGTDSDTNSPILVLTWADGSEEVFHPNR